MAELECCPSDEIAIDYLETLIENAIPAIQDQGVTVGESEGNSMEQFNNEQE